jgi:microcystin-dependent protein
VGSEPISGWLVCDGSAYSVAARPELASLFNLIGNSYGGTTSSNFQVPNTVDRTPWGGSGSGTYAHNVTNRSNSTSLATHTLLINQIPLHYHTAGVGSVTEAAHSFNTSIEGATHTHTTTWGPTGLLGTGFDNPRYFLIYSGAAPASSYQTSYGDSSHNHTFSTTTTAAAHTHTLTIGNIGSSTPHENMPPYIKLLFLIKY